MYELYDLNGLRTTLL